MLRFRGKLASAIGPAVLAIGALTSCGAIVIKMTNDGRASAPAAVAPTTVAPPVDPTPLELGQLSLSAANFNPVFDTVTVAASLNKTAEIDAAIVPANGGPATRSFTSLPADREIRLAWDGKDDRGKLVAPGSYRIELHATDSSGHQALRTSDPVNVINKYILVLESRQTLSAYSDASLFLETPVTTGGPELPTPTGTFHILDKTQHLYVYSPWPKGSPYWFPDVTYQYALDFYENSQYGLYIHDASWRKNYGPGSNAVDGTPGQDDTGTHGCINVPLEAQEQLYPWAPVGTPVVVRS